MSGRLERLRNPVKAATYHELAVREATGGYQATAILEELSEGRARGDRWRGRAAAGRDSWLVTDERAALIAQLRRPARSSEATPAVDECRSGTLTITPRTVVHTSHPTFGYVIRVPEGRVVWAPEFFRFPRWAAGADLMFAEAAAFSRPILFAKGVGLHATAPSVCRTTRKHHVKRFVLTHIGRPTIRALDSGGRPELGEVGEDGSVYLLVRGGRTLKLAQRSPGGHRHPRGRWPPRLVCKEHGDRALDLIIACRKVQPEIPCLDASHQEQHALVRDARHESKKLGGDDMFRFTRTTTTRNAADMPAAIQFGTEVCGYLNKTYSLNLKFGVELFGGATCHWHFDTDSLDKINALNGKLMQDRQYLGLLEKVKDIWVEGSLKDTIVNFLA